MGDTKPIAHRRSHTKSRHGCLQCKKSRTKCDEEKPSCTKCLRTGRNCSLRTPGSTLLVVSEPNPPSISPVTSLNGDTGSSDKSETTGGSVLDRSLTKSDHKDEHSITSQSPSDENTFTSAERTRLRLMNHYACSVAKTIAELTLPNEVGLSLWSLNAPQLAFEHDFILHGILGISALHLALSDPSSQHNNLALAIRHHEAGSAQFRSHLTNITTDNIEILYVFSCIVALHCFGMNRAALSQRNSLAKLHEVLSFIRGTGVIASNGADRLMQGPWGAGLMTSDMRVPQKLSDEIEDMLTELTQRIHASISTNTRSSVYHEAINALRLSLSLATTRMHTQANIVLFPCTVPQEYMTMVCIGEPLALAILANYAVILYRLRDQIWMEGWGKETIVAVQEALPPDWQGCIKWAVKELQDEPTG